MSSDDEVEELAGEDESTYTFRKVEAEVEEERNGFARVELEDSSKAKKFLVGFTN